MAYLWLYGLPHSYIKRTYQVCWSIDCIYPILRLNLYKLSGPQIYVCHMPSWNSLCATRICIVASSSWIGHLPKVVRHNSQIHSEVTNGRHRCLLSSLTFLMSYTTQLTIRKTLSSRETNSLPKPVICPSFFSGNQSIN